MKKDFIKKTEDLENAILKRQQFLKKVVDCVLEVLYAVGEKVKHEVHSYHTNSVWELKDFHGFSFYANLGQTEMGGNTLRITFKGATVFRVYWQVADFDVEDCKVEEFDRSAGWQTAMLSIVEQKDELIAASNKTKEDAIENKKSESIALGKLDNLKKKAESLGLKLDD